MIGTIRVACLLVALAFAGVAAAQVDLEQFLKHDTYESIKLSPDGLYYAATVPLEDRTGLVLIRRSDMAVVAKVGGGKDSAIANFYWASDVRVVIEMAERLGTRNQPYPTGVLYSLGVDGEPAKAIFGDVGHGFLGGSYNMSGSYEVAFVIDPLPDDPNYILARVWRTGGDPKTHVEKINIFTGGRSVVATIGVYDADFVADRHGVVRFAFGSLASNATQTYYRDDAQSDWRLINDEQKSGQTVTPLGFSIDGKTAYLRSTRTHGPDAIEAWDPGDGKRETVLQDNDVDPFDILRDVDGSSVLGAQYMYANVYSKYVDSDSPTSLLYQRLGKAFPDSAVTITSMTRDGRLALVDVWNDRTSGDYYLFDAQKNLASGIFVQRKWFDPEKLPKSRAFLLKARDGVALHGYLTLPVGSDSPVALPMVVMPHGGPFTVFDEWQFDADALILAQAGYAVMRLNYRGSSNYGREFADLGARQWGGTMQDDLTDATRWAISEKIADPKRICIYGASYGGYAALMGVAKEPELYRCAAGYVGVYDLEMMRQDKSGESRLLASFEDQWVGEHGSLAALSPVTLAGKIKVPVFLAAGGADTTAPIKHSKEMERALRDAKVPVQTLYIDSEGHGFYSDEHRRAFYTQLLDFLARNIGGQRAK